MSDDILIPLVIVGTILWASTYFIEVIVKYVKRWKKKS